MPYNIRIDLFLTRANVEFSRPINTSFSKKHTITLCYELPQLLFNIIFLIIFLIIIDTFFNISILIVYLSINHIHILSPRTFQTLSDFNENWHWSWPVHENKHSRLQKNRLISIYYGTCNAKLQNQHLTLTLKRGVKSSRTESSRLPRRTHNEFPQNRPCT